MRAVKRLASSVSAWMRRIVESRDAPTFRRVQTNLDGVMNVRTHRDASTPRTRLRQANFVRAPGRTVDWPAPPPAEWRRRMYEDYLN